MPPDHPIHRRVTAGSHPDFLLIRPEFDEKKKEFKPEISVEEARRVSEFMTLTPSESTWRVALIDSVDELNRNAANAILKVLEEPPSKAILILVSHNPGRLLPTIRSRCQALPVPALSPQEFLNVLAQKNIILGEGEGRALAMLSGLSPGRAIALQNAGGVAMYMALIELFGAYPNIPLAKMQSFLDAHIKRDGEQSWQMLGWLFDFFLSRVQKTAALRNPPDEIIPGERDTLQALASSASPDVWFAAWERSCTMWSEASRLYLDKRLVLQQFLLELSSPASMAA